jgi:hypothetical protein
VCGVFVTKALWNKHLNRLIQLLPLISEQFSVCEFTRTISPSLLTMTIASGADSNSARNLASARAPRVTELSEGWSFISRRQGNCCWEQIYDVHVKAYNYPARGKGKKN